MILTLLAQLPLIPVRQPVDLISYNKAVLMLAMATYLTLGYLIYANKMPAVASQYLPAQQWLIALVVLDLALYIIIHRFQFGLFPVLSAQQLPDGGTPYMITSDQPDPTDGNNKVGGQKTSIDNLEPEEDLEDQQSSTEMDLTAEEVDELSSILKQRGGGYSRQVNDCHHIDHWTQDELQTALPMENSRPDLTDHPLNKKYEQFTDPTERSMTDGDYFQKNNQSQAVVENWDEEEFSNMEYLSR